MRWTPKHFRATQGVIRGGAAAQRWRSASRLRLESWWQTSLDIRSPSVLLTKPEARCKQGRSKRALERKPECLGKQKGCQNVIALSSIQTVRDEVGGP